MYDQHAGKGNLPVLQVVENDSSAGPIPTEADVFQCYIVPVDFDARVAATVVIQDGQEIDVVLPLSGEESLDVYYCLRHLVDAAGDRIKPAYKDSLTKIIERLESCRKQQLPNLVVES